VANVQHHQKGVIIRSCSNPEQLYCGRREQGQTRWGGQNYPIIEIQGPLVLRRAIVQAAAISLALCGSCQKLQGTALTCQAIDVQRIQKQQAHCQSTLHVPVMKMSEGRMRKIDYLNLNRL